MTKRRLITLAVGALYLLFWVGGVGTYIALGAPPADAAWTAPLFLMLAAALVLLATPRDEYRDLAIIAGIGYASEFIGVYTGIIFSDYTYTAALGPDIFGVPLVMTCAWTILVVYVRQIVRAVPIGWIGAAILGAAWMTAIDLVIDPLAAGRLGYWRWAASGPWFGIPLHNFAGWFVVSAVIFLVLRRPASPSLTTAVTGWSIVLFFTVIALATSMILPGIVGLALCVAHPTLVYALPSARAWPPVSANSSSGASTSRLRPMRAK